MSEEVLLEITRVMKGEKFKNIFKVLLLGILASFMVLLMLFVAFAQFFLSNVLPNIGEQYALAFILLGMNFISVASSVIVGFLLLDTVSRKSIVYSSFLAFICSEVTIMIVSFVGMLILYPQVYNGVNGVEYLFTIPISIVYFSVYALESYIILFVMIVVFYFIYFALFLSLLYSERKLKDKKKKKKKKIIKGVYY